MDNQLDAFMWIINGMLSAGTLLWSCECLYREHKKRWIKIAQIGIIIVTFFSISMQTLNFPG